MSKNFNAGQTKGPAGTGKAAPSDDRLAGADDAKSASQQNAGLGGASNEDSRLSRQADPGRGARSAEDSALTGDGVTSEDELRQRLQNEFLHQALPSVPEIPGYHVCWLTTTSQYDPIQRRLRIGYQLVRLDELQGYSNQKVNSAEYADYVTVNEMVLAKLPENLYQVYMKMFHHDAPNDEARKIMERVEEMKAQARDSSGQDLIKEEGDGFSSLRADLKRSGVPYF